MTQRIYNHEAVHPKYGCIAAIKSCLLILCELLLQSPWLHAIQTKVIPKLDEFLHPITRSVTHAYISSFWEVC